ncbi:Spo7-like protein-domain-containing protein [Lentinula edodes]|nr:Spo7-like protein-domain-containing protein [Lentinula edodes]KAJ3920535.1 Spo7-like protein-domain-containing protein [Lentinula edodes]
MSLPSSSISSSNSVSPTTLTPFLFPPNDSTTYRDLILFEERLKSNAASLQKRKQRYQLFLVQLFTVITFLLYEVLVSPEASLLAIPYTWLLQRLGLFPLDLSTTIHPYLTTGLLFVSVTTLVLFFASGMYSEKIAYANKYVPHTNKALRSFNIYLNVRKPPLRSKFQFCYWNPLLFLFPRPSSLTTTSDVSSRSPSPSPHNSTPTKRSSSNSTSTMIPISPIPPTLNPRGELILSSRIDRGFRESYERYRAAFERKRELKEREERAARWRHKFWAWVMFWRKPEPEPKHTRTASLLRGNSRGTPPALRTPPRTPPPSSPRGRHDANDCERNVSPSREGRKDNANMRAMALERSTNLIENNKQYKRDQ